MGNFWRLYKSTPCSPTASTNQTRMGYVFENCWVLVNAGMSSKLLWHGHLGHTCHRFAITDLEIAEVFLKSKVVLFIIIPYILWEQRQGEVSIFLITRGQDPFEGMNLKVLIKRKEPFSWEHCTNIFS